MITLLAETATMVDGQTVLYIIGGLLGLGGGASYASYKSGRKNAEPRQIINDPLNVKYVENFVTREEFKELKEDIDELRRIQRLGETNAHKRMDVMTEKLGHIDGQLGVIIKLLEK